MIGISWKTLTLEMLHSRLVILNGVLRYKQEQCHVCGNEGRCKITTTKYRCFRGIVNEVKQRTVRLYEQGADYLSIGRYVRRW